MRKGRTLEIVVATLEKVLSGKTGVTVISPYKVPDKTNAIHKRRREHDVAILHGDTHHRFVIALECRDRSRPVTREHVEAFSRKCQDTGVHKGVIVSAKGFRETAKEKAKFLEIGCLTMQDVANFDWLLAPEFVQFGTNLRAHNWLFIPEIDINPKPISFLVLDESGAEVIKEVFAANVQRIWEQHPQFHLVPGIHRFKIKFLLKGWQLFDKSTGLKHKLKQANTLAEIEVFKRAVPFKKVRYGDAQTNTSIAQAAIASFEAGPFTGDIVMLDKGEGVQVLYVPRSKA